MDELDDIPALEQASFSFSSSIDDAFASEASSSAQLLLINGAAYTLRQTPIIQSIYATSRLNQMVDIRQIARSVWNAVYDPKRSQHGVQISLRNPRTTTTIFSSGKMICLGARSTASALLACRKVARLIQRLPRCHEVQLLEFRVHNVTASGSIGYRVDLSALSRHPLHERWSSYDADQFPGLHYKIPSMLLYGNAKLETLKSEAAVAGDLSVASVAAAAAAAADAASSTEAKVSFTMTLYYSGKFTLVGASSERDIFLAFDLMSRNLWAFATANSFPPQAPREHYEQWLQWANHQERAARSDSTWEEEERTVTGMLMRMFSKSHLSARDRVGDALDRSTASSSVKAEQSCVIAESVEWE